MRVDSERMVEQPHASSPSRLQLNREEEVSLPWPNKDWVISNGLGTLDMEDSEWVVSPLVGLSTVQQTLSSQTGTLCWKFFFFSPTVHLFHPALLWGGRHHRVTEKVSAVLFKATGKLFHGLCLLLFDWSGSAFVLRNVQVSSRRWPFSESRTVYFNLMTISVLFGLFWASWDSNLYLSFSQPCPTVCLRKTRARLSHSIPQHT